MRVSGRMIGVVAIAVVVVVSAWVAVATEDTETTPTSGATSTATTVSSSTPVMSMSVASSSTTGATRQLSPAWVGAQEQLGMLEDLSFDETGIVQARRVSDYMSSNPNEWATPMGALCWADFEIIRTFDMAGQREALDHDLIPMVIEELGIDGQVGSGRGPATSRAVIAILEGYATTTTMAGAAASPGAWYATSEVIAVLRLLDDAGGTGMESLDALDAVAGEEWAAAVRAGNGLPADVLQYADGLAANAREQLASGNPKINSYMFGIWVDGYEAFVELAKYDQNCLRTMIGDPPPPLPDIPALTTTTTEVGATTTTVRSGSVRVSGADLNGLLIRGEAGVGVGYSRPAGVGSFDDTTFTHNGVGYEVERLLWWPNGTIRLDTYPGGLDAAVGDDAWLVITPLVDPATEYVWDTGDAQHLGSGADFVWDTTFTPDAQALYRVELRIGVPGVPQNVDLSEALITWDAPSGGPAVGTYYVWVRSTLADGTGESFYNVPTLDAERFYDITNMAPLFGEEFIVQVRSHNSVGYSPWTEAATFTTPTSTTTST